MGTPDVVVLGFQGNVSEHVEAIGAALDRLSIRARVAQATDPISIRNARALAIPGGESTTISKLVASNGLKDEILGLARSGRPILGTCAGLILLSRVVNGRDVSGDPGYPAIMDLSVRRNAFGRQRESFETEIELDLPTGTVKETGIFIRAPMIEETYNGCRPVSRVDGTIVAAMQGNVIGTCFHPELSAHSRIYDHLLLNSGLGAGKSV